VEALASALDVTRTQVRAAIRFYAFLHERPRGDFDILLSDNITDQMLGNRRLVGLLCERLGVSPGVPRPDGRVTVGLTSCTGMCDQGPALLVNGLAVTRLDAGRIDRIADLVGQGTPVAHWPGDFFRVEDNIRRTGLLLSNPVTDAAGLHRLFDIGAEGGLTDPTAPVCAGVAAPASPLRSSGSSAARPRATSTSSSATRTRGSPAPSRTGSCSPPTPIWSSRA
jgi:[NiFe] hydrogenase diaphorase moiety large subunit